MIMADVLKIVLIIAGTLAVFICYWLAAEALFPSLVERARHRYQAQPLRITLVGLAVTAPALLIGVGLGQAPHPLLKLMALCIGLIPVLLGMIGSAGLSQRIGCGLPSGLDATQPWRRVLRGGVVLAFTFLLPILGWFFVLPWTLISGVGAWVLSVRRASLPAAELPPVLPAEGVAG